MAKGKWNFAVVKSIFGDYWVGKTKLALESNKIFEKFQDAIDKAKDLFQGANPEFDEFNYDDTDDALYNPELERVWNELEDAEEENTEEIMKGVENKIVS